MADAVDTTTLGVSKAAGLKGFEGKLGESIEDTLLKIRATLERFADYQKDLSISINAANQAMDDTASRGKAVPDVELTPEQQSTIGTAAGTDSPVHVSPGVTLTPDQARQHYLDQAEAAREEAARQLNAQLDLRLQEIIDGLPKSEYDPDARASGGPGADGTGGSPSVYDPGTSGGGYPGGGSGDSPTVNSPGIDGGGTSPGGGSGGGSGGGTLVNDPGSGGGGSGGSGSDGDGGYDGPSIHDPGTNPPWRPDYVGDPPLVGDPPRFDDPRIDGITGGVIPGTGGGGGAGGVGGSAVGGGVGGSVGGISGGVAGGIAGGVAGGAARRVGGTGVGSIGGIGSASGTAADVGGSANAQSGAAGGRGMMAGGMGGAAGAGSDKKNRRRGQDLAAFDVGDEGETSPDLGDAGAAGRAESEGREELGW
ncbi:hypothetical protein [Microbacterium halotolerans]|uniref:hypothetical protein n=1 Tax=Microbacterium halotolerans TaxID=246613 RepID=UPI000E6AB098|nr:hypothetical protein [Microbacterium halotolerans]